MRFKSIGRKIGNIAFKVAMSSCSGKCGKCGICQNPSPPMLQGERQSRGKRNSGDDGMRN